MDTIPLDLRTAALAARDRLGGLASTVALAGTRGGTNVQTAMAGAAEAAIFSDALLGAMHARFEELRTVAK